MATTETRTGFRLPWSSEHRAVEETAAPTEAAEGASAEAAEATGATEAAASGSGVESLAVAGPTEAEATEATAGATAEAAAGEPAHDRPTPAAEMTSTTMLETVTAPSMRAAPAPSAKRPTKFLADLTRAMQTAAEVERAEILERFKAEAKAFVEQIQERSGSEATLIRKHADDDVAGIRDWSKAEIARIREETDERIADRKSRLDREIAAHAARIEHEVERVQSTVDGYETDMARFFEGLMNEDDPTSFAERAANLPEPPSLEDALAAPDRPESAPVAEAAVAEVVATPLAEPVAEHLPAQAFQDDPPLGHHADAARQDATTETSQATAEAPAPEAEAEPVDPRVAALGLTPDFAAAEAEALATVDADHGDDGSGEEIPALDDDTIAARLAGLPQPAAEPVEEPRSTQVVVTGLVSVASIAGFKRHLSRIAGVRSVGVSSGPEGEFLFSVTHGDEVVLQDTIPTLPGFAARITANGEGVLHVSAHDPETDA